MNELRTLGSLVDALSQHGDQPAVLALHKESIERWSYAELADQVRRLVETGSSRRDAVAEVASRRGISRRVVYDAATRL